MRVVSHHLRRRIEAEETAKILDELQRQVGYYSFLTAPRSIIRRYRWWIDRCGEVTVAFWLAVLAVIANYILFVRMLHLDP